MRRSTAGMWWSEGSRRARQFIARQGGLDCAVAIPRLIRESRRQRPIDFDASQLFKLILR